MYRRAGRERVAVQRPTTTMREAEAHLDTASSERLRGNSFGAGP